VKIDRTTDLDWIKAWFDKPECRQEKWPDLSLEAWKATFDLLKVVAYRIEDETGPIGCLLFELRGEIAEIHSAWIARGKVAVRGTRKVIRQLLEEFDQVNEIETNYQPDQRHINWYVAAVLGGFGLNIPGHATITRKEIECLPLD
jgi:hypothetical protein